MTTPEKKLGATCLTFDNNDNTSLFSNNKRADNETNNNVNRGYKVHGVLIPHEIERPLQCLSLNFPSQNLPFSELTSYFSEVDSIKLVKSEFKKELEAFYDSMLLNGDRLTFNGNLSQFLMQIEMINNNNNSNNNAQDNKNDYESSKFAVWPPDLFNHPTLNDRREKVTNNTAANTYLILYKTGYHSIQIERFERFNLRALKFAKSCLSDGLNQINLFGDVLVLKVQSYNKGRDQITFSPSMSLNDLVGMTECYPLESFDDVCWLRHIQGKHQQNLYNLFGGNNQNAMHKGPIGQYIEVLGEPPNFSASGDGGDDNEKGNSKNKMNSNLYQSLWREDSTQHACQLMFDVDKFEEFQRANTPTRLTDDECFQTIFSFAEEFEKKLPDIKLAATTLIHRTTEKYKNDPSLDELAQLKSIASKIFLLNSRLYSEIAKSRRKLGEVLTDNLRARTHVRDSIGLAYDIANDTREKDANKDINFNGALFNQNIAMQPHGGISPHNNNNYNTNPSVNTNNNPQLTQQTANSQSHSIMMQYQQQQQAAALAAQQMYPSHMAHEQQAHLRMQQDPNFYFQMQQHAMLQQQQQQQQQFQMSNQQHPWGQGGGYQQQAAQMGQHVGMHAGGPQLPQHIQHQNQQAAYYQQAHNNQQAYVMRYDGT